MKKYLCLILCALLALSAFAGCSKNGGKPTATEPAQKASLNITYDAAYSSYDSGTINAYKALCEAFLNGETEVRMNVGFANNVRRLFFTSFPLNALVKSIDLKEDESGVVIVSDLSADVIKEKTEEFVSKINEIMTACEDSNPNVFAVKAYNYIASNIKETDDLTVSCYHTVVYGEGCSFSYSQLLTYILLQKGIPACYVTALDAGNNPWGLCLANIKDEWYYLDVMSEFKDNGGTLLRYFGMTTKDINAEGLSSPTYSDSTAAQDASALYFDICRFCSSYKIENNNLIITQTNRNIVQLAL